MQGLLRIFLCNPTSKFGLRPNAISDPEQIRKLTAFFSWSAWAASTARPGHSYSYTNNWPPEPLVANHLTADAIVWSMLSLAALLGGIGLLFTTFGRWNILGWHGREQQSMSFRAPDEVMLTPAQRACAWFFFVMAALFLLQALLGGASEHYRADLQSFFGIDLGRFLPFNIVRTWHVQLSIFWVSTSYLAAGIFLAPMISGREPRGRRRFRIACSAPWLWSYWEAWPESSQAFRASPAAHGSAIRGLNILTWAASGRSSSPLDCCSGL